jgi:hypothetical protein
MRRRNWPWVLAALLLLIGVCGYLLFSRRVVEAPRVAWPPQVLQGRPTRNPAPPTPFIPAPTSSAIEEATPQATPPPLVKNSDPTVIDLVRGLSTHPQLGTWLATKGLTRRFVVSVANIAEGATPSSQVPFLRPTGTFRIKERGQLQFVDPSSYKRYDLVADVFASLDPQGGATAYRAAKPLLEEAYRELGTPNHNFDDVVAQAIAELLATPVVDGDIELRPLVTTYAFANPKLEALAPVQRQFLRMGPRNMRLIQAQLRAIASALGISEGAAPGD